MWRNVLDPMDLKIDTEITKTAGINPIVYWTGKMFFPPDKGALLEGQIC